jgi:inosine/xanthosine triphosphate pyrophosphatase family protein
MPARPRCAILLTFLNSNRECSNKDSRVLSELRASTLATAVVEVFTVAEDSTVVLRTLPAKPGLRTEQYCSAKHRNTD